MFRGARKEELILIADELGEIINPEMKVLNPEMKFPHKACHNQNGLRNYFKYIPPHSRRDETNLNLKENKIYNSKQNNCNDEFGKITLSSAFGENVEAKLIKTSITLDNNSLNHPMDCLVAITDKLNAEALIPPSLYEALCSINNETNENDIFAESVVSFTQFSNDENDAESGNEIFYVESDSDNLNFNSNYSKMKNEQNNCDSLKKLGVIFEDDHEFGEIHSTPNLSRSTSERVLHETDLNHLKETEREQVLAILLKHRTLFTSDVKIAK
ncbi:transposon Ty3-I Gag-Pol polyprotein, partial [Trichonephila clavata]